MDHTKVAYTYLIGPDACEVSDKILDYIGSLPMTKSGYIKQYDCGINDVYISVFHIRTFGIFTSAFCYPDDEKCAGSIVSVRVDNKGIYNDDDFEEYVIKRRFNKTKSARKG